MDYESLMAGPEPGPESGPYDALMRPPRNPAMPADWAQNIVRGVGGKIADLVMAPKRAMEQGVETGNVVPWAWDTATLMAGGASPFAQKGAAGIFGGKLAQTADKAALAKAEEMAASGTPREQIWKDTGWFKGGDDKWRFEIPDNLALLTGKRYKNQTMQQEMLHPDLYAAYPETADIGMYYGARPNSGSYLAKSPSDRESINVSADASNPSVHLHELQHAIQAREGFSRGANPDSKDIKSAASEVFRQALNSPAGRRYGELQAKRNAIPRTSLTPSDQDEMMQIYKDNFDMYKLQKDLYHRSAGEVEARNVQTRMNMTPEELRSRPPWLTEDVPSNQQIIPQGGGPQMSVPPIAQDNAISVDSLSERIRKALENNPVAKEPFLRPLDKARLANAQKSSDQSVLEDQYLLGPNPTREEFKKWSLRTFDEKPPPAPTVTPMSVPLKSADLPALKKQLETALFSENRQEFPSLARSLSESLSVEEAKSLARDFSGARATSKKDAMNKIMNRWQSLETTRLKALSIDGRSAG